MDEDRIYRALERLEAQLGELRDKCDSSFCNLHAQVHNVDKRLAVLEATVVVEEPPKSKLKSPAVISAGAGGGMVFLFEILKWVADQLRS